MIKDGGPAFPSAWQNEGDRNDQAPDGVTVPPNFVHHMQGMSLRDYFAAKAIGPVLATPWFQHASSQKGSSEYGEELANEAYEIADAMLKARKA